MHASLCTRAGQASTWRRNSFFRPWCAQHSRGRACASQATCLPLRASTPRPPHPFPAPTLRARFPLAPPTPAPRLACRGHSFLSLNAGLLDRYAACETAADVIEAQNAFLAGEGAPRGAGAPAGPAGVAVGQGSACLCWLGLAARFVVCGPRRDSKPAGSLFVHCCAAGGEGGSGSEAGGDDDDYIGAGNLPPSGSDSEEEGGYGSGAGGSGRGGGRGYLDRGFLPPSDSEEEYSSEAEQEEEAVGQGGGAGGEIGGGGGQQGAPGGAGAEGAAEQLQGLAVR